MAHHFRIEPGSEAILTEIAHGFLVGNGVFTTMRVESSRKIPFLQAHYQRLQRDCLFFRLAFPWESLSDFEATIRAFLQSLPDLREQVLRISVIAAEPLSPKQIGNLPTAVFFALREPPVVETVQACTVTFDRLFPQHKHLSHVAESVYLREAYVKGARDYLRISSAGILTEAAYANLFLVLNTGELLTPDVEKAGCLPGVMREHVISASHRLEIPIKEGVYAPSLLNEVAGVFLCNAVRGLYAVSRVDEIHYEPQRIQPLLEELMTDLRSHNKTLP